MKLQKFNKSLAKTIEAFQTEEDLKSQLNRLNKDTETKYSLWNLRTLDFKYKGASLPIGLTLTMIILLFANYKNAEQSKTSN